MPDWKLQHPKPNSLYPFAQLCFSCVMYHIVIVLVAQSCPTLCNPVECSPPGSSVRGILQARILEWIAIPYSRGSSWPRDWTQVSFITGRFFIIWATREVHKLLKKKKYKYTCYRVHLLSLPLLLPRPPERKATVQQELPLTEGCVQRCLQWAGVCLTTHCLRDSVSDSAYQEPESHRLVWRSDHIILWVISLGVPTIGKA